MFSKIKPDLTAVQLSFVAPLTWEWRTSLWIYKGYIRIQTKISYFNQRSTKSDTYFWRTHAQQV